MRKGICCGIINAVTTEYKDSLYCQEAVALRVATGENRYAIENLGGMIAGLRPATTTISSTSTLSYYDYNVIVDANVGINLPTPILGQTYEIVVTSSCTLLQYGYDRLNDDLIGIIQAPRLDK